VFRLRCVVFLGCILVSGSELRFGLLRAFGPVCFSGGPCLGLRRAGVFSEPRGCVGLRRAVWPVLEAGALRGVRGAVCTWSSRSSDAKAAGWRPPGSFFGLFLVLCSSAFAGFSFPFVGQLAPESASFGEVEPNGLRLMMFFLGLGSCSSDGKAAGWRPPSSFFGLFLVLTSNAFAVLDYPFDGEMTPAGGLFGMVEVGDVATSHAGGETYVAGSCSSDGKAAGWRPPGSFFGLFLGFAAGDAHGFRSRLSKTRWLRMPGWGAARRLSITASATLCILIGVLVSAGSVSAAETHLFETSFGPDGTEATHFERPAAVGVDQSTGGIYVADVAAGRVEKFNSAHEPEEFTGLA
jgi:hypothetical protein